MTAGTEMTAILLALALGMCGAAPAATLPSSPYPDARLTPLQPALGDSVSLWLVLGQSTSTCVPLYQSTFSVVQVSNNVCVRAPCPQDYVIHLSYKEVPDLRGIACILRQTEYGPRFAFGKLGVGTYTAVDDSTKDTVLVFAVTELPVSAGVKGLVVTNKRIYSPGELVTAQFLVANNSATDTAHYGGSPDCMFDLVAVGSAGDTVYKRLAKNMACTMIYVDMSIPPGDTLKFTAVTFHAPLRRDTVTLTAQIVGDAKTEARTEITVEPATLADRGLTLLPLGGAVAGPEASGAFYGIDGRKFAAGGRVSPGIVIGTRRDAARAVPAAAVIDK